jgi:hypothetical protein
LEARFAATVPIQAGSHNQRAFGIGVVVLHGSHEDPGVPSSRVKVDLLSDKTHREPGASYRCHLSGGKHSCIEKDIEIIPMQKIVTLLPEDTFGISKIIIDYTVETKLQTLSHRSTRVEISHYYSTTALKAKAKLLNLIAKRKIARDTQATLNAAKATIEAACRGGQGLSDPVRLI